MSEYVIANGELYHWGVKGMKWGVRKKRKDKYVDPEHARAHSNTRVREMSNQELRERNNRLEAERKYRELRRQTNTGQRAVSTFIKTAGTLSAVAGAYITYKKFGKDALQAIGHLGLMAEGTASPFNPLTKWVL